MDANTVNFTIVNFDANNKVIGVTFDNHPGIVNIQLVAPLPQTQQDVENLVKQYTAPAEIVQARNDANTDISFIADLINNPITTTRFSIRPKGITLRDGTPLDANTQIDLNVTPNTLLDANVRAQLAKNRDIQLLDANVSAQLAKNRDIQQKSDFANTLISFGLLQTNPVDLSQIMQVVLPTANT